MDSGTLLPVSLLLRLGVIAAIAAVLARSMVFKRYLYQEHRTWRQKSIFALFIAVPVALGVMIRLSTPFTPADVSLEGALLIGVLGGQGAALIGALVIAAPAVLAGAAWLSLPMMLLAGWAGALLRRAAPNQEEIWDFSPFIDLEIWRWLRNRFHRPFRDWQALVFAVVIGVTLLQTELARMFPRRLFAPHPQTGWSWVAVMATNILALAIPIKIWNNTRIELKLEEQRRLLVQARLDALTSQINPHFLFNTLNSIASLVRVDPETARLLIVKLSNILRRLLRQHESLVPLREELAFIDDYLDIEIVRFGPEKLRIFKEIDPDLMEHPVPSMILQPFVENSIRHGLEPRLDGGWVLVRGRRERSAGRDEIWLEVEDNGAGIPPERLPQAQASGIGLSNVRERLRVLYGDAARLEIDSDAEQRTRVRVRLPARADTRLEQQAATPGLVGA